MSRVNYRDASGLVSTIQQTSRRTKEPMKRSSVGRARQHRREGGRRDSGVAVEIAGSQQHPWAGWSWVFVVPASWVPSWPPLNHVALMMLIYSVDRACVVLRCPSRFRLLRSPRARRCAVVQASYRKHRVFVVMGFGGIRWRVAGLGRRFAATHMLLRELVSQYVIS
jgi:hypothetical protein